MTTIELSTDRTEVRRERAGTLVRGSAGLLLYALLCLLVLGPVLALQVPAITGSDAYSRMLEIRGFGATIWRTCALALASLAIAMVLGTYLAWQSMMLSRRTAWMRVLPMLPIVLPPVATVIGWAFLLSPEVGYLNTRIRSLIGSNEPGAHGPFDVYSLLWITIITGLGLTAFVYLFMRSSFERLSSDVSEASRVCGYGPVRTFWRIALPMSRPSLIYAAATALLLGLGQFTAPLFLGRREGIDVVTTEVYRFTSNSPVDYGLASAVASPLIVIGLLVLFGQRSLLTDSFRFVSTSGRASRVDWGRSRSAPLAILGFFLFAAVLPLATLVLVALSPYWSGTFPEAFPTGQHISALFGTAQAMDAVYTSARTSILAVLVCLPIGYVVAHIQFAGSGPAWLRQVLDVLVSLPLCIPAVVFGAGYLYLFTQPQLRLYGTELAIIIVYVVLMLPFVTRFLLAGRTALGSWPEEAARVSGAGPLRTHALIMLPLLRGAAGASAALMFVLLSHEFSASLFVRSPSTQVMGTVLYDMWNNGSYPLVAAMGLLMCVVTTVGVVASLVLGGRSAGRD